MSSSHPPFPTSRPAWLGWSMGTVLLTLTGVAHIFDPWAFAHFVDDRAFDSASQLPDWKGLFRLAGFAPTWWLVALLIWLCRDQPCTFYRRWRTPTIAMIAATVAAIIVGEALKASIGRLRPCDTAGEYLYEPFRALSTSGLSMPSSHAIVAFAAAYVFAFRYHRAAVLFCIIALGCGLTRVAARAHFLSDIAAAAAIALPIAHLVYTWVVRTERADESAKAAPAPASATTLPRRARSMKPASR